MNDTPSTETKTKPRRSRRETTLLIQVLESDGLWRDEMELMSPATYEEGLKWVRTSGEPDRAYRISRAGPQVSISIETTKKVTLHENK